ncbi:MAG: acetyltransferase [Rhodoferax sp.]|nr:acetyltransferase [Rhodoferax sp.]
MSHFDVFNGDADGICALHQLRLAQPLESTLVTGVKRDIALLERVTAQTGDSVTVLDVSLNRNREALLRLLQQGVRVEYFDHHFADAVAAHPGLNVHIDPAPTVCTSLIVDRHLQGQHRLWAIVGAFGDNLGKSAQPLIQALDLDAPQIAQLRALGEAMNYNAYGDSEADLLVPPAMLYASLRAYANPFDFYANSPNTAKLLEGRRADMERARAQQPAYVLPSGNVYVLPATSWARRVHGSFANELALHATERAHAVLSADARGDYVVSVRAPVARPSGAEHLCLQFPSGGGRAAAAGIDHLAQERLQEFIDAFKQAFGLGCDSK